MGILFFHIIYSAESVPMGSRYTPVYLMPHLSPRDLTLRAAILQTFIKYANIDFLSKYAHLTISCGNI